VDVVVDTYAWVEIIRGTDKGRKAEELIANADNVYTPSIVLAELARKLLQEGEEVDDVKQKLEIIEQISLIADIDAKVAIESAKAWIELVEKARREKFSKPSLFDAIVLAIARLKNAKLITGDKHFHGLPEVIWIGS
jgi:predicted nucleic acid-binding protein